MRVTHIARKGAEITLCAVPVDLTVPATDTAALCPLCRMGAAWRLDETTAGRAVRAEIRAANERSGREPAAIRLWRIYA